MAGEKGKVIGTTPKLILTKEQVKKLNEFAAEIENIDLRPIPKKRLWREHHYMGGANGVISDLELQKLGLPPEIVTMQRFMNLLAELKFISLERLNESGTYSRPTFQSVKSLQTELNKFLAEKRKGVHVPPSQDEKRVISTVIAKISESEKSLKGSLLNAPLGKEFETKVGKLVYKVKMGTESSVGRAGFAEVFDEEGNRLKKIVFAIDKKSKKARVDSTILYNILVDGYVGIETLRAMTAYLKEKASLEKELPTPKPIYVSVKLGYSFKPDLVKNWPVENEILHGVIDKGILSKNKKYIDIINAVLWNMPHAAEKSIRDNPPVVEIDGDKYSATWQGLRQAYFNGVSVEDFLKKWINVLKFNPQLKDLIVKAEKGELKPNERVKDQDQFLMIGEMKSGTQGGSIGVDLSEISRLFGQAKENVMKKFKDNPFKEQMLDEITKMQTSVEEGVMSILHKIEKERGDNPQDKLMAELNKNKKLRETIYVMYNFYGNFPGSLSYIELDVTNTGVYYKKDLVSKVKDFIEEQQRKGNKEFIEKTFKDAGRYDESTIRMAEKFVDQYCVLKEGRMFIKLSEIKSDEMKSFALLFRWSLCTTQLEEIAKKNKEARYASAITH